MTTSEGLQFVPLVAEASGGWAPVARRTWQALGQLLAAKTGEAEAVETEQLMQALGITLQRENARAILPSRAGRVGGDSAGGAVRPSCKWSLLRAILGPGLLHSLRPVMLVCLPACGLHLGQSSLHPLRRPPLGSATSLRAACISFPPWPRVRAHPVLVLA